MIGRRGSSWDLVYRNAQVGVTPVTDETEDIGVAYALTHNGVSAGSGSLTWEDHDYTNAWVKRFTLPATPGILTATITVTATIDDEAVTGSIQTSLKVV